MISSSIRDKLYQQVNLELTAEYAYLAMAAWCKAREWSGFAEWFSAQAAEERAHGMKVMEYLLDQGEEVQFRAIEEAPTNFKTLLEIMEASLAHEQKVTKSYGELMQIARKENDYATEIFTQWFITEQVEEEAAAGAIIERLKRAGDHIGALQSIDSRVMSDRDH